MKTTSTGERLLDAFTEIRRHVAARGQMLSEDEAMRVALEEITLARDEGQVHSQERAV